MIFFKIDTKLFALTILKLNVHHIFATNESILFSIELPILNSAKYDTKY